MINFGRDSGGCDFATWKGTGDNGEPVEQTFLIEGRNILPIFDYSSKWQLKEARKKEIVQEVQEAWLLKLITAEDDEAETT